MVIGLTFVPAGLKADILYSGRHYEEAEWEEMIFARSWSKISLDALPDLKDSLTSDTVGQGSTHIIIFTQPDTLIYPGGSILLTLPIGFNPEGITSSLYQDSDTANIDFGIDSIRIFDQTIRAYLDTLGSSPESGSRIEFQFGVIVNDTISGAYQIAMAPLDRNGLVISGPHLSLPFELQPGELDSLEITPHEIKSVKAGESLIFSASCFDRYNNRFSCATSEWSVVGTHIAGDINSQGLFFARSVGFSKIVCQVNSLTDTTLGLYVLPGKFHTLLAAGFPDSIKAGSSFPDSISAEAQDVYHNRVTSYLGEVWFKSSDPQATLTYDSTHPYQFMPGDNGYRKFPGIAFTLKTAGLQTIVLTDGDSTSVSQYIMIQPDQAASFNLALPDTVAAGGQFNLEVANLADQYGNLLYGSVAVELVADGTSPDGTAPALNSVFVDEGQGSSSQMLVKSGPAQLRLSIDTLTVLSPLIYVHSAPCSRFEFELSSPQIVGVPFTSPARLLAKDGFGNMSLDFSAGGDSVIISPDGDGQVINGIIKSSSAFVAGICNLAVLDMAYQGSARFLRFKALSRSGLQGYSETVEINSSALERLDLSTASLYRGDHFYASVTIANYGSSVLAIDDLSLTSSQGTLPIDSIAPPIPLQINGNNSTTFRIYSSIPYTFVSMTTYFKAGFAGFYDQQPISDESDYLDSLKILSQQEATYIEGSLNPRIVSRGSPYAFRLALKNLGVNVISLATTSYLFFASPDDSLKAHLEIPIFMPANGEAVTLFFEDAAISDDLSTGKYSVHLYLSGLQGSSNYSEELILSDSIMVESPPLLNYVNGSFLPDSAYRNADLAPQLSIQNAGEALMATDLEFSYLELSSDSRRMIFRFKEESDSILPGSNLLKFETDQISSDFPLSSNHLRLHLEGIANDRHLILNLELGDNLLMILEQGAAQIMQTNNLSPNAPRVNTEQEFPISVMVKNLGQEALEYIRIVLESDRSAIEEDTLEIASLDPAATDSVIFAVTASSSPHAAELFRAKIISAIGAVTGMTGIILNPEDNTAVAAVQTPAQISGSIRILSPPEATNGILDINQEFVVRANFENQGQASVDLGMAELKLPTGFDSEDELLAAFEAGQPLDWTIRAPTEPGLGAIVVQIVSPPMDSNTLLPARIAVGADTLDLVVREQLPGVLARAEFDSIGLIYPGQTLIPLSLRFELDASASDKRAIISGLSFKFTDRNGNAFDLAGLLLSGTISHDQVRFPGIISGDQITFDFGEDLILAESDQIELTLELVISNNTKFESFVISSDFSLVTAKDFTFGSAGKRLAVSAPGGQEFAISKSYGAIPANFSESFFNFPNPFNPEREQTSIVYYLPINSDVRLNIYTLIGELVDSRTISSGSPGTVGGRINQLDWDGKNDAGLVVREGVYLAIIKYSGGEARTKIAVVK